MNDVHTVIREERIDVRFHPVVSVKKQAVIGFTAECRGLADDGREAPLSSLYALAQADGLTIELDRLVRKKTLEAFRDAAPEAHSLLLFLNLDTAVLDQVEVGSGHLLNQVRSHRLEPSNIVIEFTESGVRDPEALRKFVQFYRRHGFLISLHEVGSGHSNYGRITLARPDLLRVGRSLVAGVDKDYFHREILRSFTALSKKLGALVVASGAGRPEESLAALELGVDMLEETAALRPPDVGPYLAEGAEERISRLAAELKTSLVEKNKAEKARAREYEKLVSDIVKELGLTPAGGFDAKLKELIARHPVFECLYVLDPEGLQLTDTVFVPGRAVKRNSLFRPAQKGADHSSKEYYYLLNDTFVNRFTTEPYISLASGNLCFTLSSLFKDSANGDFVFCADVAVEAG